MIIDSMRFINFVDFYEKRNFVKALYTGLPLEYRVLYKYYVYSRRYMKESLCDDIWEFLNATCPEELAISSGALRKEYMRNGYYGG